MFSLPSTFCTFKPCDSNLISYPQVGNGGWANTVHELYRFIIHSKYFSISDWLKAHA